MKGLGRESKHLQGCSTELKPKGVEGGWGGGLEEAVNISQKRTTIVHELPFKKKNY